MARTTDPNGTGIWLSLVSVLDEGGNVLPTEGEGNVVEQNALFH